MFVFCLQAKTNIELRTMSNLWACAMAIGLAASSLAGNGDYAGRLNLIFFGRDGKELSYEQMRAVSNNGAAGYDNDCSVDPKNLHVLSAERPIKNKDGRIWIDLPGNQRVALAINWPTKPLGYSLLLIDNGGKGFLKSQTVNFTYQAASDAMKGLDRALAARTNFDRSEDLSELIWQAKTLLSDARRAKTESDRGRLGQLALDKIAEAQCQLLEEHAMAAVAKRKDALWLAVTFDTTANYKDNVDRAASMLHPYGWIRIVFDATTTPADYQQLVQYAHQKGLKILGQPVDSSYDKQYTTDQYMVFFKKFVEAFPQIDAWEVGNEVNGEWLTPQIAQKVSLAAAYCKQMKKTTVLTLFWQLNTSSPDHSVFNWCDSALDAKTRANLDVVTLSMYCEQGPMGLFFDRFMNQLHKVFPKQKLAVGELGYWIEGQRFWWAFDETNVPHAMRRVMEHYYLASLDYPFSVGAGFWWNYLTEFKADPWLADRLAKTRDQIRKSRESR